MSGSCVAQFEHYLQAATLVPTMRKPFDVLAEGLLSKKTRGDWTPLELLIAGVRVWEAELCRFIVWLSDGKRP